MIINSREGFTLIELLVVIAIIGVLAVTILVTIAGMRPRARDARRFKDLRTMGAALVQYSDSNDEYMPFVNNNDELDQEGNYLALDGVVTPIFISELLADPLPTPIQNYGYLAVDVDGTTIAPAEIQSFKYRLGAWSEVQNISYDLAIDQVDGEIRVSQ